MKVMYYQVVKSLSYFLKRTFVRFVRVDQYDERTVQLLPSSVTSDEDSKEPSMVPSTAVV